MPDSTSPALVVGLFASTSDAELALDNLDEADYEAAGISVVAKDAAQARLLTRVAGPLSGLPPAAFVQRLTDLGLSAAAAAAYRLGLDGGGIAVVATAPSGSEKAAAEILRDQKAQHVTTLPSNSFTSRGGATGS